MSRAKRVDKNQPSIVKECRKYDVEVAHLHMVGGGIPDVCVGVEGLSIIGDTEAVLEALKGVEGIQIIKGVNLLIEIKDDSQPPSKRVLTEPEELWHNKWKGHVCIVENEQDVEELLKPLTKTKK